MYHNFHSLLKWYKSQQQQIQWIIRVNEVHFSFTLKSRQRRTSGPALLITPNLTVSDRPPGAPAAPCPVCADSVPLTAVPPSLCESISSRGALLHLLRILLRSTEQRWPRPQSVSIFFIFYFWKRRLNLKSCCVWKLSAFLWTSSPVRCRWGCGDTHVNALMRRERPVQEKSIQLMWYGIGFFILFPLSI